MDPYEVLGIPQSATQDEIKRAYLRKARQWHPDINKSSEATEQFKRVQMAHDQLTGKAHVRFVHQPYQGTPRPAPFTSFTTDWLFNQDEFRGFASSFTDDPFLAGSFNFRDLYNFTAETDAENAQRKRIADMEIARRESIARADLAAKERKARVELDAKERKARVDLANKERRERLEASQRALQERRASFEKDRLAKLLKFQDAKNARKRGLRR